MEVGVVLCRALQCATTTSPGLSLLPDNKTSRAGNRADLKSESQLAAQKAATTIVSWLGSELSSSYAEQVLDEANHMLAAAEREGKLPKDKAPDGMSVEEIIARWRPKNLLDDEPGGTYEGDIYLARYADWLFRWAYYVFPENEVRHEAFRLAKSQLEKQGWVPPFARRRPDPAP